MDGEMCVCVSMRVSVFALPSVTIYLWVKEI